MGTQTFIVIGENGAGKGTVCAIMAELLGTLGTVHHQTVSTKLTEIIDARGLSHSRPTYAQVSAEIVFDSWQGDYLARTITHRLRQAEVAVGRALRQAKRPHFAIIDGERLEQHLHHYTWHLWPKPILIYVTAPAFLRYQRCLERAGGKAGENDLTFPEFLAQEQAWNEVDVAKMGAQAHARIDNAGSVEQLRQQVRRTLKRFVPKLPGAPQILGIQVAGPRNAGKSTFLRILSDLLGPHVKTVERPLDFPSEWCKADMIRRTSRPTAPFTRPLTPDKEDELMARWLTQQTGWLDGARMIAVEVTTDADLEIMPLENRVLISIDAPFTIRFEREALRADQIASSLLGFSSSALRRDHIRNLQERADYTICNDGSEGAFAVAVDDLLENHLLPRLDWPAGP